MLGPIRDLWPCEHMTPICSSDRAEPNQAFSWTGVAPSSSHLCCLQTLSSPGRAPSFSSEHRLSDITKVELDSLGHLSSRGHPLLPRSLPWSLLSRARTTGDVQALRMVRWCTSLAFFCPFCFFPFYSSPWPETKQVWLGGGAGCRCRN